MYHYVGWLQKVWEINYWNENIPRRKIWLALQEINCYESQSFIKQITHDSDNINNNPHGTTD